MIRRSELERLRVGVADLQRVIKTTEWGHKSGLQRRSRVLRDAFAYVENAIIDLEADCDLTEDESRALKELVVELVLMAVRAHDAALKMHAAPNLPTHGQEESSEPF
jgi:hypothetical protein